MGKSIIIILLLFMFYTTNCYDDENCETFYTGSSSHFCKKCKAGFYLTYDGRYCEECDEQQGKILRHSKCYTKVDNCQYYADNDDFCELCSYGYKRDENGQCVKCNIGEFGENNVCFKQISFCKMPYLFIEGEKCELCFKGYEFNEEQGKCIECLDGYESEEGYIFRKNVLQEKHHFMMNV